MTGNLIHVQCSVGGHLTYGVWTVLCVPVQLTLQALDEMDGCLHVVGVDDHVSVS